MRNIASGVDCARDDDFVARFGERTSASVNGGLISFTAIILATEYISHREHRGHREIN